MNSAKRHPEPLEVPSVVGRRLAKRDYLLSPKSPVSPVHPVFALGRFLGRPHNSVKSR